jgi:putative ABC transport system ATP-binding protein
MNAVVAQLHHARKSYWLGDRRVDVLKDVNLSILRGEYVAIIGPSGSGKSTLLNVLGLMDVLDEGCYVLAGEDTRCLDDDQLACLRNTRIGFIFQSFNLLSQLNVLGNIEVPTHYLGVPKRQRRHRACQLAESVGLGDRLHHRPCELSGGERQRVAIARALANEPTVLLADEPTGNLDEETGLAILAVFDELVSSGKTIIMVTHNPEYQSRVHRVVRLHDGSVTDGPSGEHKQ